MIDRIRNEPVLFVGFVETFLGLLLAFGFDMTGEQVGAILATTGAALAFVARAKVTPVRKDRDPFVVE